MTQGRVQIMEGFDTMDSTSRIAENYPLLSGFVGSALNLGLSGRGQCLWSQGASGRSHIRYVFPEGGSTKVTGAWANKYRFPSVRPFALFLSGAGSYHFGIRRNPGNGKLELEDWTGAVRGTSNTICLTENIYRFTWSVDCTNAALWKIRFFVNGQLDPGLSKDYANLKRNDGANDIGIFTQISSSDSLSTLDEIYWDDIMIATGVCEDWPPVELFALKPTSDVLKQWTRSTGADNFANVDDVPMNLDVDYNHSMTLGQRDLFNYQDLPFPTSRILALGSLIWAYKEESGIRQVRSNLRIDGVDYNSLDYSMMENMRRFITPFEKNPATGQEFTAEEINAIQHGYELRA